jgi:Ca2+-binding RTX toxin-like protein
VTVDLSAGYAIDGFGSRDSLTSIENARGTDQPDHLIGSTAANQLLGGKGADTLTGGLGTATDQFAFQQDSDFGDHITDFQPGIDKIAFWSGVSFYNTPLHVYDGTSLAGQTSSMAPALFFNTANHTLYYDANGAASGGATAIATLDNVAALTHNDIWGIL